MNMAARDKKRKDFYKILGIDKNATESQIKTAYRKMAMKHHPDKNPGDKASTERFKEISVAYTILVDPDKRRTYDLSGEYDEADVNFDGFDPSQFSPLARGLGGLLSQLGVPIPTQVPPKIREMAQDLAHGSGSRGFADASRQPRVRNLTPGQVIRECVQKQEAMFFKFKVTAAMAESGVILICRSAEMNKFKLILFDHGGEVRKIEQCIKKDKFTSAEMYFVPFDRFNYTEMAPLKFVSGEAKEVPMAFHTLDDLEAAPKTTLEPREHLICVYGDNWLFSNVTFHLQMLPALNRSGRLTRITKNEEELASRKAFLDGFEAEYMEAKKRYEEAVKELKEESDDIRNLLQDRENSYEDYIEECTSKCNSPASESMSASLNERRQRGYARQQHASYQQQPTADPLAQLFASLFG